VDLTKSARIVRDGNIATETWETTTGIIVKDANEKSVTFSYEKNGSFAGEFNFATVASRSETIDLAWDYSWFHSYFMVTTKAEVVIDRASGGTERISLLDFGPESSVGDRNNTGTLSLDLYEGDKYGVYIYGQNFDALQEFRGTFILTQN